jgi:epsilon-lactone hydrolase
MSDAGFHVPPSVMRLAIRQLGRLALNPDLSWDEQRRRLGQSDRTARLPRGTATTTTSINGIPAEIVTAAGSSPGRTVVHFHGGGYCIGSSGMARTWAAHLSAQAGCRVVLPNYRLAPEHPHPAALEDARAVMKGLLADSPAGSLIIAGDSAGGGLAMALLLSMRDSGENLPAGCILLSPWLDLSADRRSIPSLVRRDVLLTPRWLEACAAAYTGRENWTDPSVSPLLAQHDGLPPLLIQAGSDELLAPDAERMAASADAAGADVTYTRWPRMWHDFALTPGMLAAADSALAQAAWFVTRVTPGAS